MLRNYLKIAVRNLVRNGSYTAINVVGLAVVLACCVVAYLNYRFSADFDAMHAHADTVYRIQSIKTVNGEPQAWGISPMPLGPELARTHAGVERATRFAEAGGAVVVGERVFSETVQFADPALFEMFTFPLRSGRPAALADRNQVVLSAEAAVKYFGAAEPIGEPITIRFGEEDSRAYVVGAVAESIPLNSSVRFDVLLGIEEGEDTAAGAPDDWGAWSSGTFVQVTEPEQVGSVLEHTRSYLDLQNAARPDWRVERFDAVSLRDMHRTSETTRAYAFTSAVHPAAVLAPSIIAVLLLLLACFNFMNTAIAYAGRRMKEIGVRKVMGGVRRQLIGQFMGESLLLCAVAFALALLLAEVFVPAYGSLWPNIDLELRYADNLPLLLFLGGLLLVTAALAGAYPAFYVSSFEPVRILQGRQTLTGANLLTRILLTFQITVAVFVIIASLVFTRNAAYQRELDLGYDRDMTLVVPLDRAATFAPLRDAVARSPEVVRIAGARNHVGWSRQGRVAQTAAERHPVDLYDVGDGYVETMGLRLLQGQAFDEARPSDAATTVLVNETMVRAFGWSDPVGEMVTIDSVHYSVAGVVEDFYSGGFWELIQPTVLRQVEPGQFRYAAVRTTTERMADADAALREAWRQIVPHQPYEGFYQEEVVAEAYLINASIRTVFLYIALIAVLISAVGLFALVSLTIARRTKEVGIRKVLGASVAHIGYLLNREFVLVLLIASALAAVGAYFSLDLMLDSIWDYHVDMELPPFLVATLVMLAVAALSVGARVYRVATANPVESLRYE